MAYAICIVIESDSPSTPLCFLRQFFERPLVSDLTDIPLTASFHLSAVSRTEKMIELGMAVINNRRFATITIPYPDPL